MQPESKKEVLRCWAEKQASLWSWDRLWLTLSYDLCKSPSTVRGHSKLMGHPQGCETKEKTQQLHLLGGTSRFSSAQITHWVVFVWKIEKMEEIHHQFETFLSEISKPTNNYELKIANRLFGEKTYLFLQVSFIASTTSVSDIYEWPNDLVRTVGLESMLPKLAAWFGPNHSLTLCCPLPVFQTPRHLESFFFNLGSLNPFFFFFCPNPFVPA